MRPLVVSLLTLTLAVPVLAGDGRLEINQACAVNTGCFPGDAAGFPVTIDGSAGRSYVLTGDLGVSDPNLDGIEISSLDDDITIDLNGFAISGPTVCVSAGPTLACSAGSGRGIDGNFQVSVSVRNGRISGFADEGVFALGERSRAEGLVVRGNGLTGVAMGREAIVRNSRVNRNAFSGITVLDGSVVESCTSSSKRFVGIAAGGASLVARNTTIANGTDGITAILYAVIRSNTVHLNNGRGIVANGSLVIDNTVAANFGGGIVATDGSSVQRNVVKNNFDPGGIVVNTDSTYRENTVTENRTGAVTGSASANNLGANYCAGAGVVLASCP